MKDFGIPWKSVIGFGTVFLGQLLARAVIDGTPVLPTDLPGWGALLGGSLIASIAIWAKSNTYTVPQAEQHLVEAEQHAGRHARPE